MDPATSNPIGTNRILREVLTITGHEPGGPVARAAYSLVVQTRRWIRKEPHSVSVDTPYAFAEHLHGYVWYRAAEMGALAALDHDARRGVTRAVALVVAAAHCTLAA